MSADRMVLARVRKERVREREAYEFFHKFNAHHEPIWINAIEHPLVSE